MSITLYQYPGGDGIGSISPPCFKIDLALRLLGVEFDRVNLRSPRRVGRISTTGRLPVLELDGRTIHDSIRILDELEQRFEAPWRDASDQERVHDRLWEIAVNEHLYWLGFSLRWLDPEDSPRFFDALFGRMNAPSRLLVRAFLAPRQRKRARLHGSGRRDRPEILDEMVRALDMLVTTIGAGPFLQQRGSPGRGDLAVAAMLGQAGFRGSMPEVHRMIAARPALISHLGAVFAACGGEAPRWLASEPPSVA